MRKIWVSRVIRITRVIRVIVVIPYIVLVLQFTAVEKGHPVGAEIAFFSFLCVLEGF